MSTISIVTENTEKIAHDRTTIIMYFLEKSSIHKTFYYTITVLSSIALAIYTISLSWIVLTTTNKASSVGLFYMIASASSLLLTPFFSPLLTKTSHIKNIILISALVRSIALTMPLIFLELKINSAQRGNLLFTVAILFGPANSLFSSAIDALMLRNIENTNRALITKRTGLIRMVALAAGASLGGLVISLSKNGAEITAIISAALGLISGIICLTSNEANNKHPSIPFKKDDFIKKLLEGFLIIKRNHNLAYSSIILTLCFSVSQMSNSLLSPIIISQNKSAAYFGFISGSWYAGAVFTAALINIKSFSKKSISKEFFVLLLLGFFCILFSLLTSKLIQTITFTLMGGTFAYLRVLSTSNIALYTPNDKIGQVQIANSNIISFFSIIIYIIPTILQKMLPTSIFFAWGLIIMAVSLFFLKKILFNSSNEIKFELNKISPHNTD